MNEARVKKNELVIGHMERLAAIHQMILAPRMGGDAVTGYEMNKVREAIASLANEIGTTPIEVPF